MWSISIWRRGIGLPEVKAALLSYEGTLRESLRLRQLVNNLNFKTCLNVAKKYIKSKLVIKFDQIFHVYVQGQGQEIEAGHDKVRGEN